MRDTDEEERRAHSKREGGKTRDREREKEKEWRKDKENDVTLDLYCFALNNTLCGNSDG